MIALKVIGHIMAIGVLVLAQVVYWVKVSRGQPLTDKDVPVVVQHGLLWLVWLLILGAELYFLIGVDIL